MVRSWVWSCGLAQVSWYTPSSEHCRTLFPCRYATSFSGILLDKSVILLIQKMPLLCGRKSGPAALAPSSLMFQRGEGPLLVASGFVKYDTTAYTIPVLDLLGSRDEIGVAARRKIEEQVVSV